MGNIWAFLQQTGAAAITALFLLVLQRIFLRHLSPRWQYGVWSVLLLRLVVPVRVGYRSAYLDIAPWIERLRTWTELRLSSRYASPWQETLPRFPWPELPVQAPASVTDWLFVLYTAGVVLCVIWYGLQALRLHLRVREGVPVAGERLQRMKETAEGYGLSMPQRVVECRWTATPFLMGVFRPTLVLPMEWDMEEKVLLHELLHLKYQDVLAGWVTTLFRCLHWCNPILWLAFDKIGNDRECLCDQRVLERLEGEERRDYGRVLLSMADNRSIRIPGATTMANGARSVAARIQAIARFKRYPQGMTLVSVCITLSLAYALVAGTPIQALVQESGGTVSAPSSMAGALSTGQLNRPTTVAGALDTYGKGVLLKYDDPYTALLCAAMTAPEENLPALVEQWKKTDDLQRSRWTTGPQFRGLVSDGSGVKMTESRETSVLLPCVRVIGIANENGSFREGGSSSGTVFVSLPPQQAMILIAAQRESELYPVLRKRNDSVALNRKDGGVVNAETFAGIRKGLAPAELPEVPNKDPQIVPMQSIIASQKFQECKYDLPIALGKTITDEIFITDLCKMPHIL